MTNHEKYKLKYKSEEDILKELKGNIIPTIRFCTMIKRQNNRQR
jgi:hypothetical protein